VLWVSGSRDTAYPPAYTAEVLEALRDHRVQLDARELDADHALLPVARDEVRAWLARRIAAAPA
jgi:predicted esterase